MGRSVDFDEFELLRGLVDDARIRRASSPFCGDGEWVVVVRPHPRDVPGKYDSYRRVCDPRVIVTAAGTPAEALAGADLVAGMRSALLDEAQLLGRPVHRLI